MFNKTRKNKATAAAEAESYSGEFRGLIAWFDASRWNARCIEPFFVRMSA